MRVPEASPVVSFFGGGVPFRILSIEWVQPKKGTTMEPMGRCYEMLRP